MIAEGSLPVNTAAQKRLAALKDDYKSVTGQTWSHFFCPILHQDEDTQLCRAHVINKSFRNSDRSWTIQRADVDSCYGTLMEEEFSALQEKDHQQHHGALGVVIDHNLHRKLNPVIKRDGEAIGHYIPQGPVPEEHSEIWLVSPDKLGRLALKISPDQIQEASNWEVSINKMFPLQALAALLKAAHLTLFHLLGYRYALSGSGFFLGRDVLGRFFLDSRHMERRRALERAYFHFRKFANLVRPILSRPLSFQGTLTDDLLYLCMSGDEPWAYMVFVRTGNHMHGVIVPILDNSRNSDRFAHFCRTPHQTLKVRLARWMGGVWEISPNCKIFEWPKAQLDVAISLGAK